MERESSLATPVRIYSGQVIEFRLSLDALGQTRFAYSPLAEASASLWKLRSHQVGPFLRPWWEEVSRGLPSLDLDPLRAVVSPGPLAPDFLFMWSLDPQTTIDQQLERLADLPEETIRRDLETAWAGQPAPPPALELMDGGSTARRRLVDALRSYWEVAIGPYWSRIRAVLDDDVSHRATQVLNGGLYTLLSDLHPEVSLRDGVLHVDKPHLQDATYHDGKLTLLPSVFVWPRLIIIHQMSGRFDVMYPARGVGRVWELDAGAGSVDALGELVGRTRAAILTRLEIPRSTTQLARELGQSPGTISQHLSVLRRSGLLASWRSGRSVLYRRTPLASSIIAMSRPEPGSHQLA